MYNSTLDARPDFDGKSGGGGKYLGEVQRSSSRPPWKVKAYCRTGQNQRRDVCMYCTVHMYQCINEL
jgi:hypothetical protein